MKDISVRDLPEITLTAFEGGVLDRTTASICQMEKIRLIASPKAIQFVGGRDEFIKQVSHPCSNFK